MNNLIKSRFPLKSNNMIEEYLWAIETFQNEIDKGTFELYAGDCICFSLSQTHLGFQRFLLSPSSFLFSY